MRSPKTWPFEGGGRGAERNRSFRPCSACRLPLATPRLLVSLGTPLVSDPAPALRTGGLIENRKGSECLACIVISIRSL